MDSESTTWFVWGFKDSKVVRRILTKCSTAEEARIVFEALTTCDKVSMCRQATYDDLLTVIRELEDLLKRPQGKTNARNSS